MGKTTQENSPVSHSGNQFERMNMMSEVLSNFSILDPCSSSFAATISKILPGLEALPSLALIAMNKKLKNVAVLPRFPVIISCKRNALINRLTKKCQRILLSVGEGGQLPKPLAKALMVMFLSAKQVSGKVNIETPKFFPFNPRIENLQKKILKAIQLLPSVKLVKLKHLVHVIVPNASIPLKSLRTAFHNYMMEVLFHCDEMPATKKSALVINFIHKASGGREQIEKEVTEEVEATLNLRSHIRQALWESTPDEIMGQDFANLGDEYDCDITIDENEDCSTFGYSDYLRTCEPDDEAEGTGDNMSFLSYLDFHSKNRNSSQFNEGKQESPTSEDMTE